MCRLLYPYVHYRWENAGGDRRGNFVPTLSNFCCANSAPRHPLVVNDTPLSFGDYSFHVPRRDRAGAPLAVLMFAGVPSNIMAKDFAISKAMALIFTALPMQLPVVASATS